MFQGHNIANIDFKTMLAANIALNKETIDREDTRPLQNNYYYGGELIAIIKFTFTMDNADAIIYRKEELFYIDKNENESSPILIKEWTFNPDIQKHHFIRLEEREQKRKNVITAMKAFLAGVLMAAEGMTTEAEAAARVRPLWEKTHTMRTDYIELGTSEYIDFITNTTDYDYLDYPVDENGTTARQYMISRLS